MGNGKWEMENGKWEMENGKNPGYRLCTVVDHRPLVIREAEWDCNR